MVFANNNKSSFSLTLTDAFTGAYRREYVDAMGTTWVKGEKDDEFFFVLKNEDSRDALCKILVDGVDVGYSYKMPRTQTSDPIGVLKSGQSWSDSKLISHALKFVEKKQNVADIKDDEDGRLPSMGSVTVQWYALKIDFDSTVSDQTKMTSSWSGTLDVSTSSMHKKEQSQLRSEEGASASTLSNDPNGPIARFGDLLATTTLCYTSDFGLAVRGLLSADETGMSVKRQRTTE
tara:strand:- start:20246 stop:20944 length:699 start_codon:yes stop_codon:yes gene_type:complete